MKQEEGDGIIKRTEDMPPIVTLEDKFELGAHCWDGLSDEAKWVFNWLHEYVDRNVVACFATDIFKLDGFTNQQIKTVQNIINAAKFNIPYKALEFIQEHQFNYNEDGIYEPPIGD